jgi:heterogeneous nuclear ribonucleoprotein L
MVEFETLETAVKARNTMHGCDIYNGCCTMKVEFSKMEQLRVRENGPMSWDFQAVCARIRNNISNYSRDM